MKLKYCLFVFVILGLAFSCRQQDLCVIPDEGLNVEDQAYRISITDGVLSAQDASNVAMLYNQEVSPRTKSAANRKVKDVMPLFDDEGNPIMYAVNYDRRQGFLLVSASTDYYPVIADVESGEFNDNVYECGMGILLQEYKADIAYCKQLPTDSLQVFKSFWRKYLKEEEKTHFQATKSGDLLSLLSESMYEWTSDGYLYQSLQDGCPDAMSSSEYYRFCSVAEASTNPDYLDSYMDLSFILTPDPNYQLTEVGPLMTTTWHQDPYFNMYCFTADSLQARVGCAAVAMGQIMRYHQYPTSFNWSQMPDNSATPTTAAFLSDIGANINMNYDVFISKAKYCNVRSAFINHYGYSCAPDSVEQSLDNYRPVFMRGAPTTSESGHAWVCDGYREDQVSDYFILKTLSFSYPLEYESTAYSGTYHTQTYYHMNWGEYGVSNGWFIRTYCAGFSEVRKNIYNLHPADNS